MCEDELMPEQGRRSPNQNNVSVPVDFDNSRGSTYTMVVGKRTCPYDDLWSVQVGTDFIKWATLHVLLN